MNNRQSPFETGEFLAHGSEQEEHAPEGQFAFVRFASVGQAWTVTRPLLKLWIILVPILSVGGWGVGWFVRSLQLSTPEWLAHRSVGPFAAWIVFWISICAMVWFLRGTTFRFPRLTFNSWLLICLGGTIWCGTLFYLPWLLPSLLATYAIAENALDELNDMGRENWETFQRFTKENKDLEHHGVHRTENY